MEKIDQELNNLKMSEVPKGMHQFVMSEVSLHMNQQKLQPMLLVVFSILVVNFLLIVWHINSKLIDAEFLDMTQDFFEVFSLNSAFIATTIGNFFEIISPVLVVSALLSLSGAIYTGRKIRLDIFARA